MVIYNAATKELTAKIVYYGAGLCGKTTNLKVLHDRLEPGTAGKLLNLQTQTDRTIYFDLLPVELGDIKGYKIRFQLATVPGQTAFNETRRVVLKGVDGIVFVADSQWTMLPKNLETWQNLKDNLKVNGIGFESIPIVVQYNKRDLGDILAVDAMQEALGLSSYPFVEAVASAGRGVTETFKLISKLTFVDLLRRLQGRRAEEASLPPVEEKSAADDLQTWKDSLLHRDSQPAVPVSRPSRPLALVPPVPDDAPFDTTELARGVDDEDEDPGSPYQVSAPLEAEAGLDQPDALADSAPASTASTIRMEAVRFDEPDAPPPPPEPGEMEAEEPPEILSEADEVAMDAGESGDHPSFLPPDSVRDDRIELLERRLRELDDRSGAGRGETERIQNAVATLESQVASLLQSVTAMSERVQGMERGISSLQEAIAAASDRTSVEAIGARHGELEAALRRLEAGLAEFDERARSAASRERKDADDIAMALRGLTERAQAAEQQIGHLHQAAGSHEEALSAHRGEIERVLGIEGQMDGLREAAGRIAVLEAAVAALREAAERVPAVESRLSGLEGASRQAGERVPALEEQISSLRGVLDRVPALEQQLSALRESGERLPSLEDQVSSLRAVVDRLPALEQQLSGLRESGDRLPSLEDRAETLQRQLRELEATLEEKTHQGRREAEDIRSQIAPLLEDRVRRHESDAMLFSEMERLRESLAESLHDIAERVRSRVRD